ncbi:VWA domain-containing protein [Pelagicoccus enzymogenes]|uniref:vWA domain-containing protein n=1 Tax=Pelagicoccus enzymogenes TaxID=2773457 RepID=UPI0028108679|nr:VWA domain-containing protein [Pelagicoccus enzymogenes]MDQ8199928.1 VWA domain-containing protein [Pelagicoccus enzymogenes]
MKSVCDRVWRSLACKSAACTLAGLLLGGTLASQTEEEEEEIFELSPFEVTGAADVGYRATSVLSGSRINTKLGATVGGAQDIRYMRSLVEDGVIPSSASFTPEGLFSEHDLPIGGLAPEGWLFDIAAQAMPFHSSSQPRVEALAQLGFVSGIDAATFQPAPLNLVAVVDKSGSMNGQPLDLVRKSLKQAVSQMGSDDQISIVLYGSSTEVHLQPTVVTEENRTQIMDSIDRIQSYGSTAMEMGLQLGYETARKSQETFTGRTRLMLFTDERPNVGRTDAHSFMSMAKAASEEGIGLTTIGVSVHFGADLAEKISSVRGGNLFYFEDQESMENTFRKEFDTMVLELAYDMNLRIDPTEGVAITGMYGIPGDAVSWEEDGSLNLEVSTLFASRNKGAIYLGFGRADPSEQASLGDGPLATASITYTQADNRKNRHSEVPIVFTPANQRQEGLLKGSYLAEQYASMKLATLLYESSQYEQAAKLALEFADKDLPLADKGLEQECKLAKEFAKHLLDDCKQRGIAVAGYHKEKRNGKSDSLFGEWVERDSGLLDETKEILRITPEQTAELYDSTETNPLRFIDESSIEINRRYIVFKDWGQTFRYRLGKETLELQDGDKTTTYRRTPGLAQVRESSLLDQLRAKVSGLPEPRGPDVFSATR